MSATSPTQVAWFPALPAEGWASMDRYWTELDRCEKARQDKDGITAAAPEWLGGPPAHSAASGRLKRALQKHFLYPRRAARQKADIAHVLDHSYAHLIPKLRQRCRKVIATVFDLVPLQMPEGMSSAQVERFRRTVLHLNQADHLISISRETKVRLHELLGIPPERVTVARPGMDFARFQASVPFENAVSQRLHGLPEILLSVGSAIPRKNLASLPGIFSHFREEFQQGHCVFVRAGERLPHDLRRRFEEVIGSAGIVELGPLFGDDLIAAYQCARIFLFPSTLEGLTFTIPEAMAAGCAVVTNRSTANPEAAGDAALFYNEGDTATAAQHIVSLLKDDALHADLSRRGQDRAREMSWEAHYEIVREVYQAVSGNQPVMAFEKSSA